MTDADPNHTLRSLLDELLICTGSLRQILTAERRALADHRVNALNDHTEAKQECLAQLEALEVRRRALLQGMGLDPAQELILPELDALWQVILAELRECQDANEVNGAIVRAHQVQTQHTLDLLTGRDGRQTGYDAHGQPTGGHGSEEIARA